MERDIGRQEVVEADDVQEALHGWGNVRQAEPAGALLCGAVGVTRKWMPLVSMNVTC
ncbi:hypothetical protein QF030_000159 [Streptomyces rishiriensis]|uniref:Uncharacterized protein n=1 Tax=Streptomyces rishiriensis TaxID=68264 RepID=A0ABU0NFV5_STRRH|nr:hypothetical protein [Streptomyces rishiriensis]